MNVDELEAALRAPAPPMTVSVDRVVSRGRWLRRRRQAGLIGAAAGVTVTVAVTATAAVSTAGGSAPAGSTASPGAVTMAPTTPPPSPPARRSAGGRLHPAFELDLKGPPWGEPIPTGHRGAGGRETLFWFSRVRVPGKPQAAIGTILGYRDAAGRLVGDKGGTSGTLLTHVTGFGGGWQQSQDSQTDWILAGYYVGPAARITAELDGRQVEARTAPWSVDPDVLVYWLSPQVTPGAPTRLDHRRMVRFTAFDSVGRQLDRSR